MPIDFTQFYSAPTGGGKILPGSTLPAGLPLPLRVGESAQALVAKTAVLEASQYRQLSGQDPGGAQGKTPGSPEGALKAPLAPVAAALKALEGALVGERNLQLASLVIKNETITTVTAMPLVKGQTIQVRLGPDSQLYLTPDKPATHSPAQAPATTAAAALLASQVPAAVTNRPALADLQQSLRELLPQKDRPALIAQLQPLQQAVRELPATPATQRLITTLGELARLPLAVDQPPPAARLKTAIIQSGSLLEARLQTAIQSGSPAPAAQDVLKTDAKALLLQLVALTRPGQENGLLGSAAKPGPVGPGPTAAPAGLVPPSTLVAPLVGAPLSPSIPGAATTVSAPLPSAAQAPTQTGHNLPSDTAMQLPALLQLLSGRSASTSGQEMRILQTQLVMLIHQLSLANLAKIRLSQLQPETQRGRSEAASAAPGLSVELPVRHDDQTHLAHLKIFEDEEERDSTPGRSRQQKVWQVLLQLDTPGAGEFHAQLRFNQNTLGVTFWSPETAVLGDAKEKFSSIRRALEASGIGVNEVHFRQGLPERGGNSLGYSLVDIKT